MPKELDSKTIKKNHLTEHDEILEEYESRKAVSSIKYNPKSTSFVIPETIVGFQRSELKRLVVLEKTDCEYKKLLFFTIYSAFYQIYYTNEYPYDQKRRFRSLAPIIVKYINSYVFEKGHEIKFFRNYEAFRINEDKVFPESAGLRYLVSWINIVLSIDVYCKSLDHWQHIFLISASRIKALTNCGYERKQITLTEWFSFSTWLRRDDVGVGHQLYAKLASPKAVVSSFVCTITVALDEIQLAKEALLNFFIENEVNSIDFPQIFNEDKFGSRDEYLEYRAEYKKKILKRLKQIYHECSEKNKHVELAIVLVLKEMVTDRSLSLIMQLFYNNEELIKFIRFNGENYSVFSTTTDQVLFGDEFLVELAKFAALSDRKGVDKPKAMVEQVIFSWLMACQTVQPSDISKLKLSDFTFVERVNGAVTHVALDYFKGRSNVVHQVKTLETKSLIGKVVFRYIQDFANDTFDDKNKKLINKCNFLWRTVGKLFKFCDSDIPTRVEANLKKEQVSPVFLKSFLTIIDNGKGYLKKSKLSYKEYMQKGHLKQKKDVFTLTAIKNSAVHSRSDNFTPTQLINYHSHSNDVEHKYYLTSENQEWLNNTGLTTRAVVHDLTMNLYRASLRQRVEFNLEFTRATNIISNKKTDILSKIKLVKNEAKDQYSNLQKTINETSDFYDTIKLLDTPETVFELLHYIDEAKKNHHLLAKSSGEFLIFTVLPTVEWIEELFDRKEFSNDSITRGQMLFNKYEHHLPPLFSNQIS